jgi:thiamine biosynthesis protein ThiI
MHQTILVRYAEIGLKGNNRSVFENKLVANMRACLADQGITADMERRFGRILIHTAAKPDLSKVFGIASYSFAINAGKTLESLQETVKHFLKNTGSFRVTCYRLDKQFPIPSNTIARGLGAFIQKETGAKVDLEQFDREFVVEIVHGALYFIAETVAGPGGLPLGIEGRVLALVDSKRAEDAALLLMKRGCTVVPLLHKNYALKLLPQYSRGFPLNPISLDNHDIDALAKKEDAKALVVGDTLNELHDYKTTLPILRPLVGGIA